MEQSYSVVENKNFNTIINANNKLMTLGCGHPLFQGFGHQEVHCKMIPKWTSNSLPNKQRCDGSKPFQASVGH
jgi:hypothetical protein